MVHRTDEDMIMAIQQVGIVGAGQMGNGIAHVFALAGYEVLMNDISGDALKAAVDLIKRNLERQVGKDLITEAEKTDALARIGTTQTLTDLGQTDLIIEAATEREDIKRKIFEAVGKILGDQAVLASNTSSIPITPRRPSSSQIAQTNELASMVFSKKGPFSMDIF